MKYIFYTLRFLIFLAFSFQGFAQTKGYEITNIYPNTTSKTLDVNIRSVATGQMPNDASIITVADEVDGKKYPARIRRFKRLDSNANNKDSTAHSVLFILDMSSSMRDTIFDKTGKVQKIEPRFSKIREGLIKLVKSNKLSSKCNYYLATFNDNIQPLKGFSLLKKPTVDITLKNISFGANTAKANSDLFRTLIVKLEEFSTQKTNKIVILITDSKNDITDNKNYKKFNAGSKLEPFTSKDVLDKITDFDESYSIFPISIGADADPTFLKAIVDSTKSKIDTYTKLETVNDFEATLGAIFTGLTNNYALQIVPPSPIFKGESHKITISWENNKLEKEYSFGTVTEPIDLRTTTAKDNSPLLYWVSLFLGGLIFVFGLLALMSALFPILRQRIFKKHFVKPYKEVKQANVVKRDPLTGEAYRDDELVVVKCKQMTSLSSWEYNGYQCLNYPDCLNAGTPCNGAGANTENERFFSQKGIFKQLNWLWFGSFGGFIAWTILAFFKNLNFGESLGNAFYAMGLADPLTKVGGIKEQSLQMNTLANDSLMGLALGAGLSFVLSWVEERGQARQLSWGRILLRTFLGGLISFFIFIIGFYTQYLILPHPYLSGLLEWTLFAAILGAILSIQSSITLGRGMLGGLIAGLAGFQIYNIISLLYEDFALAKLISFIIMGAILGVIIVSVIARLEDFELEYISPEKFRRVNPISKWLKSGINVDIGSDPSSYVFIKWVDPDVKTRHATLSYNDGHVYITAIAETLVNGRVIPMDKKVELKDGDIIQPGKNSVTRMKFKEKSPNHSSSSGAEVHAAIPKGGEKPSIKITKR